VRALLGETFRLLAAHLNLFTLISLSVWLPGHVVLSYLQFFSPGEDAAIRWAFTLLTLQIVFDPIVVSAITVALAALEQQLPAGFGESLWRGLLRWRNVLPIRFTIYSAVLAVGAGTLYVNRLDAGGRLLGGIVVFGVGIAAVAVFVRCAVVEQVAVLEATGPLRAWRRAAQVTRGMRWRILGVLAVLSAVVLSFATVLLYVTHTVFALDHFVSRVLINSAISVVQSVFTIALFLFYWRARTAAAVEQPAPAASA
jgi:hypothetical protein